MANTGFKGIDVRQTGNQLLFRAFLQTALGALLGTGTTTLSIIELQSDGTVKSYDFNDNTFKTTALTTATLAMTHRPSNNAGTTTGVWTVALATLTGFTVGGIYVAIVNNSGAGPTDQFTTFQYGSAEGDLVVTAGATGLGYIVGDLLYMDGTTITGTAGKIAASFKLMHNVATPLLTTAAGLGGAVITTGSFAAGAINAAAIADAAIDLAAFATDTHSGGSGLIVLR